MFGKRAPRFMLAAAAVITAATAFTAVGVTRPAPLRPVLMPCPVSTRPACTRGRQAASPGDRCVQLPRGDSRRPVQRRPGVRRDRGSPTYDLRFFTTQGVITVKMLTTEAPCTTFSFRFLVSQGYFNFTHCHRLTTQGIYVLQCGDPTGTGSAARDMSSTTRTSPGRRIPPERSPWPTPDRTPTAASSSSPGRTRRLRPTTRRSDGDRRHGRAAEDRRSRR